MSWTYVIGDLNGEEIVGAIQKKDCKKPIQKDCRVPKVTKKKSINYMLHGKSKIVLLIVVLMKKDSINE